ncbi:MAG TPA: DegT/DnrJ/EryC1/StrS family aminotransferase [Microthrixaceae bacterium]|nr:DegT/DnrJ/EryC1/StrS family aminotransferase [Microthrixaceae bacterium]
MTNIPLVDLGWQRDQISAEVEAGWAQVLERTAFIDGPAVAEFEGAFAAYCGTARCVGVANGTDAIELALRALDIGAGDEVILPANTFIATAEAVVRAGATPVLVDQDEASFLIDVGQAAESVGARTRAIAGVHLYGQIAPLERLAPIAEERGLVLVEDAAQSQGATRNGKGMGSHGRVAATSFYPGKNLGAYGDAGAVLTDDDELADRIATIRAHGSRVRYRHDEMGVNSRLDTLQAVVLSAKLARLDEWNRLRREAAARYDELLADIEEVVTPTTLDGNEHVWHLYVVRVPDRDRVLEALQSEGIGAAIHYPVPVHLHPAFDFLGQGVGSFPVAERVAAEILTIPLYPGITADQQSRVATALHDALA